MAVAESKELKKLRETAEREIIVEEVEKLKKEGENGNRYILIAVNEQETRMHSYKFDFFEEIVWVLNIAQTLAMEKIQQAQSAAEEES